MAGLLDESPRILNGAIIEQHKHRMGVLESIWTLYQSVQSSNESIDIVERKWKEHLKRLWQNPIITHWFPQGTKSCPAEYADQFLQVTTFAFCGALTWTRFEAASCRTCLTCGNKSYNVAKEPSNLLVLQIPVQNHDAAVKDDNLHELNLSAQMNLSEDNFKNYSDWTSKMPPLTLNDVLDYNLNDTVELKCGSAIQCEGREARVETKLQPKPQVLLLHVKRLDYVCEPGWNKKYMQKAPYKKSQVLNRRHILIPLELEYDGVYYDLRSTTLYSPGHYIADSISEDSSWATHNDAKTFNTDRKEWLTRACVLYFQKRIESV